MVRKAIKAILNSNPGGSCRKEKAVITDAHLFFGPRPSGPSPRADGASPRAAALRMRLRKGASPVMRLLLTTLTLFSLGLLGPNVFAVGESASLSSSGVNFEITPTSANPNGTVAIGTDNLTVSSTCSSGYKLYISTTSNDESGTSLTNADNAEYSIPAVSGTIASPTLLNSSASKNHWGFAMVSGDTGIADTGFSESTNATVTNTSLFSSIPTLDNMTTIRQKTSSADNETVNVYYGVNAGTDLTPGSYSSTVMYTMVMPSPCDYTLMFEDGISEDDPVESEVIKMPETTTAGHGDTVNLGDYISKYAREGYSITGWKNITDDLTYSKDETVDVNLTNVDIIKLAPIWTLDTYDITLNSGTGINTTTIIVSKDTSTETGNTSASVTDSSPSITVGFGSTLQISYAVSSGYHFGEWEITSVGTDSEGNPLLGPDDLSLLSGLDSSNNSVYTFSTPASDATLTAKAEGNKYAVHFDGNGGTGEMDDVEMIYGSGSTLPANTFTAPAGSEYIAYEFYGWSVEKQDPSTDPERDYTDGQTGVFNLTTSNTAGTGEATLYAVWKSAYVTEKTMQGWNDCTSLTISTAGNYNDENTYVDLMDVRNNVIYRVRRYSSGSCWMSQNLALTPGSSAPDASVASGSRDLTAVDSQGSGAITYTDTFSTSSYTELEARYDTSNASSAINTTYFSWNAATIACPVGWTLPTQTQWTSFLSTEGIADSAAGSTKIRNAPYNFMYTGAYKGSSMENASSAFYWSATMKATNQIYTLYFYSSRINSTHNNSNFIGFPVRCIKESFLPGQTMQSATDTQCANLGLHKTVSLKDSRNSVSYNVTKMADGNCWMTTNLALTPGSSAPTANVTSGSRTLSTSDSQGSGTVSFVSAFSTSSYTSAQARYDTSNASSSKNTGYYNWTAARLVCPAGWTLPTQTEWSDFLSKESIADSSAGSTKIRGAPYNFAHTGNYDGSSLNNTSFGVYWSSTVSPSNTNGAYNLYFDSSAVYATSLNHKYRGFAVRCLHASS